MAPITVNCVSVRRMSEAKCDPYCSHQSERRFTPELPLQIVPPSHSITSSAYATTKFDASRAARQVPRLLRRDVGDPHDLAPLLGFSGDEGSELLGIEQHRHRAEIGEPRLDRRLRDHGADLAIEAAQGGLRRLSRELPGWKRDHALILLSA